MDTGGIYCSSLYMIDGRINEVGLNEVGHVQKDVNPFCAYIYELFSFCIRLKFWLVSFELQEGVVATYPATPRLVQAS